MPSSENYYILNRTYKGNLRKKYDEKYERLLSQLEKENLFLKDEIRSKSRKHFIRKCFKSFQRKTFQKLSRTIKLIKTSK